MTTSVEGDLSDKLETSSLQSGKEAADLIKAQANEAFKSTIILILHLMSSLS